MNVRVCDSCQKNIAQGEGYRITKYGTAGWTVIPVSRLGRHVMDDQEQHACTPKCFAEMMKKAQSE